MFCSFPKELQKTTEIIGLSLWIQTLFSRQKATGMLCLGNRYKSFLCFSSTRVDQRLAQAQITSPDKDVTVKKPRYWLHQVHACSPGAELSRLPLAGFRADRDVWQRSSSEPALFWEVSCFLFCSSSCHVAFASHGAWELICMQFACYQVFRKEVWACVLCSDMPCKACDGGLIQQKSWYGSKR